MTKVESSKAFAFIFAIIITLSVMKSLGNFQFENVQAPIEDKPPVIPEVTVKVNEIELLDEQLIPSKQPFLPEAYKKYPRILVDGNFKSASLKVTGLNDSGERTFLLLNVGNQTGIINAVRKDVNRIDMKATTELGGVFGKVIVTGVDLMNAELGSNSDFFKQTGLGKQTFHFIQPEQVIQVYPIIVLPFDESGSYTGQITSMKLIYTCENDCEVLLCNKGEKDSECIHRERSSEAMQDWLSRNGYN